ncbi:response regulator [Propionispora vibrioides]|uniref:DNA-binding response regulator, OmpR family, contains REC and winged-helix (WHTH) domain n=1 Tax=Propionispora vibrioides TaxID=112903 RepID=A0A1H8RCH6_9FIRM|nr:response regulator transcription factor [Propionispora vibrioides]SEO63868.1 DNA-binding response regulator, OmpR family, contains REC and winged-helix (wHTH) domain [Propionispora vibrioides]
MRILVVEDDEVLREAVADILLEEGYEVACEEAGDEGLYAARQGIHDLLVLDIMLPEISGLEIVRTLRSEGCTVPILLLTARDSIDDRVQGLEAGADDYVVKPFAMRELLARLKALLRRKGNLMPEDRLTYGNIVLNSALRDACIGETCLGLGSKEYDILEFLLLNSEQILTREQVFDRIWGMNSDTGMGIVDIYIHHLRKKLAPYGQDRLVQTVRGVGFMLKEP